MDGASRNPAPSLPAILIAAVGCTVFSLFLLGARDHHAADAAPAADSVNVAAPVKVSVRPADSGTFALMSNQPLRLSDMTAIESSTSAELLHSATDAAPAVPAAAVITPTVAPATGRVIWMEVTAYCGCKKCCGPGAHGITASGRGISYNGGVFVAADTRLLPFGTTLRVPGYSGGAPAEVIDRGSAIKGRHIDIFFPSHDQAKAWGRQWLPVTVDER